MENTRKSIDFFVDFLLNKNQQDLAILINDNKDKIAYYFIKKKEGIEKCFRFFSIWQNKLYIHFRSSKKQKWEKEYIELNKIKELENKPTKIGEIELEKL